MRMLTQFYSPRCFPFLAWGGTVSFDLTLVSEFGYYPGCGASASGTSVAITSASLCSPSYPYSAYPVTLSSSSSGWTAIATGGIGGQFYYDGDERASAGLVPTAIIMGGTGSGFLQVEFSDTLTFDDYQYSGGADTASAGDLSYSILCISGSGFFCDQHLTDTFWSGWIPFVFGEPVSLPAMYASFSSQGFEEGPAPYSTSWMQT